MLLSAAVPVLAAAPTSSADFLKQAVRADSIDAKLGQLAIEKSGSAGVQRLGHMLVDDQAATGADATRLADTLQVSLPVGGAADQEATYRALANLSGDSFDAAFVDAVIQRSRAGIADCEAQAQSSDPKIADFADQALPLLQKHLRMARMLKMRSEEHGTP